MFSTNNDSTLPFTVSRNQSANSILNTIDETTASTSSNINQTVDFDTDNNVYDESTADTFNIYLVNEEIVYTQPTSFTDDGGIDVSRLAERSSNHFVHSTTDVCDDQDDIIKEMFITGDSDEMDISDDALRELGYNSFELNAIKIHQCHGCNCTTDTEAQLRLHKFSCCKYLTT